MSKYDKHDALNAAISGIRIWSTSIQPNTIPPTPGAVKRLASILQNNHGLGTMDLVWGPDIELIETDDTGHTVGCFMSPEEHSDALREGIARLLGQS